MDAETTTRSRRGSSRTARLPGTPSTSPPRAGQHDLAFADVESGLTLLGFVGFTDPRWCWP